MIKFVVFEILFNLRKYKTANLTLSSILSMPFLSKIISNICYQIQIQKKNTIVDLSNFHCIEHDEYSCQKSKYQRNEKVFD